MVTGYNLSKDVIEGLAKRAKESGRSASKELEVILVGVLGLSRAMGEVAATKEISGDGGLTEVVLEEIRTFPGKAKDSFRVVEEVITGPNTSIVTVMKDAVKKVSDGQNKIAVTVAKSEIVEKIAKGIPGVVKASELPSSAIEVADEMEAEFFYGTVSNENSPKKRAKDTGVAKQYEMTKGFYKEQFSSIEEAETEAKKLGWKPDEYKIEDVIG